jgi:diacylglycerol kinase family enzyme
VYTCTTTSGGKSETKTDKLECDEFPTDGVLRDDRGNAIGTITVGGDGTIRVAAGVKGESISIVCVPVG